MLKIFFYCRIIYSVNVLFIYGGHSMRYFLKKSTPSKKGLYLQIYQSSYVPGKGPRNRSYKAIGYCSDLAAKGIPDPIKYAQDMVDELNEGIPNRQEQKVGDASLKRNLGHFLLKSV